MARGFQGAMMRGFGARDHLATVTGSERRAPQVLRIHLVSATLLADAVVAPTAWLRFWFPDPDGGSSEFQRAYTIVQADEATGAFTVDFVLHEPVGPASRWAQNAVPGTTISVSSLGSSRFDLPTELPAGYLLIGDSASMPAINQILTVVPADVPVELYLEQHTEDDRQIPLASHPRVRVHWVRGAGPDALASALEPRDWSDWKAWVACEATSLKRVRVRLRDEFGFPKSEVHAQAYWSRGRAMGKLRSGDEGPPKAAADNAADAVDLEIAPTVPSDQQTGRPDPAMAPRTAGSWRAQAAGRLLAPKRATLIIAGVLQAIVTLVELAPFVLLVRLARLLGDGADSAAYWAVGIWAVVLLGFGTLLGSSLLLWLHAVDARFARGLRQRLLGKLSRLPLGWFTRHGSGAVKQLVQDDTLGLHYLTTHAIPDAVAAVIAPVAVLIYLFAVDWRLALALFIPVLVYLVTMWVMVVQSGPKTAEAPLWAERMNTEAATFLDGQPVIRVFGGAAASGFRSRLEAYVSFLGDWQRPFTGKKTLIDLASRPATFLLVIAVFGTLRITVGQMPTVDLLPFLLLGTTFGARLLGIGYGLSGIRDGMIAVRRIQVTLDEPELGEPDAGETSAATDPIGRVVFDRVAFGYRPDVAVIKDVSLTLEPGTVTALVGPSGSGKSTLAGLLARFHDVDAGAIRVGGGDVRGLTSDQLYTRVGFVLQDAELVRGTVAENIALAVPDATDDRVEAAARAAQIHDRVLRLPSGYDTELGPETTLSGGELQRLTIARAILADSPVLVLDEATAFADPESEHLVQQALDRLTAGRTVLVIAHRLRTITGAHRIVVLEHGRITEDGTHQQLLADGGRYHDLWHAEADRTAEEVAR